MNEHQGKGCKLIWSHNENKEISNFIADHSEVICPKCGRYVKKYVKSHYTGGIPCVLLTSSILITKVRCMALKTHC